MTSCKPSTGSAIIQYGAVPVPWTASWSAEEEQGHFLEHCRFAGSLALCMHEARGQGVPRFGKPHSVRQRQAIAEGLCDLCAKPLAARTKVSLSHARPVAHAAQIGDILQVEPLLHRECARVSLRNCPALKRDLRDGTARVRQVLRYAVQIAIMSAEYGAEIAGDRRKAAGHAKVQLIKWIDRDADWLMAHPERAHVGAPHGQETSLREELNHD